MTSRPYSEAWLVQPELLDFAFSPTTIGFLDDVLRPLQEIHSKEVKAPR